jgi:hypothetical protein
MVAHIPMDCPNRCHLQTLKNKIWNRLSFKHIHQIARLYCMGLRDCMVIGTTTTYAISAHHH